MSAIDFSKITKTLDGIDCCYLGQRKSGDQVLHRFAVFNNAAELFSYYNEQGERIEFFGNDGWAVCKGGRQIIAPPKIVEVTRWITYHRDDNGDIGCRYHSYDPDGKQLDGFIGVEKVTKRFEVPNE